MYEKKILGFNKKIRTKLAFPPQKKNWHNRTTVLYTKFVRNTKNPPNTYSHVREENSRIQQENSY